MAKRLKVSDSLHGILYRFFIENVSLSKFHFYAKPFIDQCFQNLYCTACGGVVDADVDEKQVMRLVRRQKDVVVQDCAVVLFGLCEACAKKQAEG